MTQRNWFILGASSRIAVAFMRHILRPGDRVCLAARDAAELALLKADIEIRTGATAYIKACDLTELTDPAAFIENTRQHMGGLNAVFIATGELGDQNFARQNLDWHNRIILSNFTGITQILHAVANLFEAQKDGFITVLSSVAGDRGRQSNYIYGAAKAAINAYLAGLRGRLDKLGVHVLTVKLGYTDTRMIYGTTNSALTTSPEAVAEAIGTAMQRKKDTIYVPGFWALIMLIIRSIPERLFKRLPL